MKKEILAIAMLAAVCAAAQSETPSGKPDFSGVWQTGGVSLFGEGASPAGPPTANAPKPQPAPYQDWTLAKVKEYQDGLAKADPIGHCFLPGVPRISTMPMPFEIVQTPSKVVILYEAFHGFRIIPFTNKHPGDLDPTFMGDSVAHWEGNTLVVDVTGFNDKTWLDGRGHFHSDQLHVVERYRANSDNTVALEVMMEDPKVMTKPWVMNLTLRHPPRADRVMEYECLENNQDTEHLVGAQARAK